MNRSARTAGAPRGAPALSRAGRSRARRRCARRGGRRARRAGAPLHGGLRQPDRGARRHAGGHRLHRPRRPGELRPRGAARTRSTSSSTTTSGTMRGRSPTPRTRSPGRSTSTSCTTGMPRRTPPSSTKLEARRHPGPRAQPRRVRRAALHDRQRGGRPHGRRSARGLRRAQLARAEQDRSRCWGRSAPRPSASPSACRG